MPEMPPADDLDFLLANGERYAVLGSGERVQPGDSGLPVDMGTHLVLGTARKGGVRVIGTVPPGTPVLDPTRRWLGIKQDGPEPSLHLFDTADGLRPGFRFSAPGIAGDVSIHPEGHLIACREAGEIRLHGPDGHLLRAAKYAAPRPGWPDEAFAFSTCGAYLWLVHTRTGRTGTLYLLRCPSLEVAETCPPTHDPSNPYDAEGRWFELAVTTNPATGHLAVRRQVGDDYLTLHFYSVGPGGRIARRPEHIAIKDDLPGECIGEAVFSADGKRFLLLDSDGFLHEFSFPACRLTGRTVQSWLQAEPYGDGEIESFGYAGPRIALVNLGGDLLVLRSIVPGLTHSPLPVEAGFDVLESGLLWRRQADHLEIAEYRLEGRPFPVIAALDSKSARAVAVYCTTRSRWRDITAEVGWLETRFPVVRE